MTIEQIILHDSRLSGRIFPRSGTELIETRCENNARIAERIRAAATINRAVPGQMVTLSQRQPVPILSIMAHGASVIDGSPDWVMQVGLDHIHRDNARAFGTAIRHCISDRIRVLCCNAAGSEDACMACRELAVGAGVQVFAGVTNQNYSEQEMLDNGGRLMRRMTGEAPPGWIQFGQWEGAVMRFPSTGEPGEIAFEGPPPRPTDPPVTGGATFVCP